MELVPRQKLSASKREWSCPPARNRIGEQQKLTKLSRRSGNRIKETSISSSQIFDHTNARRKYNVSFCVSVCLGPSAKIGGLNLSSYNDTGDVPLRRFRRPQSES